MLFSFLVPESGPEITNINATSSTSISVTWAALPANLTNGDIIHYIVCYKNQTSQDICSFMETVGMVNDRKTVLKNLNEFTTYQVAVKAATANGTGPNGGIKHATTLQDSKYQ
jgi:hypothetical protein